MLFALADQEMLAASALRERTANYKEKPVKGLEPLTTRLQGECSTTELHRHALDLALLDLATRPLYHSLSSEKGEILPPLPGPGYPFFVKTLIQAHSLFLAIGSSKCYTEVQKNSLACEGG